MRINTMKMMAAEGEFAHWVQIDWKSDKLVTIALRDYNFLGSKCLTRDHRER